MRTFKITIPSIRDLIALGTEHANLLLWFRELKAEILHQTKVIEAIEVGLGSKADSALADERNRAIEHRLERLEHRDAILTGRCDELCRKLANLESDRQQQSIAFDNRMTKQGDRIIDLEHAMPRQLHEWRKPEEGEGLACKVCGEVVAPGACTYTLCKGPKAT